MGEEDPAGPAGPALQAQLDDNGDIVHSDEGPPPLHVVEGGPEPKLRPSDHDKMDNDAVDKTTLRQSSVSFAMKQLSSVPEHSPTNSGEEKGPIETGKAKGGKKTKNGGGKVKGTLSAEKSFPVENEDAPPGLEDHDPEAQEGASAGISSIPGFGSNSFGRVREQMDRETASAGRSLKRSLSGHQVREQTSSDAAKRKKEALMRRSTSQDIKDEADGDEADENTAAAGPGQKESGSGETQDTPTFGDDKRRVSALLLDEMMAKMAEQRAKKQKEQKGNSGEAGLEKFGSESLLLSLAKGKIAEEKGAHPAELDDAAQNPAVFNALVDNLVDEIMQHYGMDNLKEAEGEEKKEGEKVKPPPPKPKETDQLLLEEPPKAEKQNDKVDEEASPTENLTDQLLIDSQHESVILFPSDSDACSSSSYSELQIQEIALEKGYSTLSDVSELVNLSTLRKASSSRRNSPSASRFHNKKKQISPFKTAGEIPPRSTDVSPKRDQVVVLHQRSFNHSSKITATAARQNSGKTNSKKKRPLQDRDARSAIHDFYRDGTHHQQFNSGSLGVNSVGISVSETVLDPQETRETKRDGEKLCSLTSSVLSGSSEQNSSSSLSATSRTNPSSTSSSLTASSSSSSSSDVTANSSISSLMQPNTIVQTPLDESSDSKPAEPADILSDSVDKFPSLQRLLQKLSGPSKKSAISTAKNSSKSSGISSALSFDQVPCSRGVLWPSKATGGSASLSATRGEIQGAENPENFKNNESAMVTMDSNTKTDKLQTSIGANRSASEPTLTQSESQMSVSGSAVQKSESKSSLPRKSKLDTISETISDFPALSRLISQKRGKQIDKQMEPDASAFDVVTSIQNRVQKVGSIVRNFGKSISNGDVMKDTYIKVGENEEKNALRPLTCVTQASVSPKQHKNKIRVTLKGVKVQEIEDEHVVEEETREKVETRDILNAHLGTKTSVVSKTTVTVRKEVKATTSKSAYFKLNTENGFDRSKSETKQQMGLNVRRNAKYAEKKRVLLLQIQKQIDDLIKAKELKVVVARTTAGSITGSGKCNVPVERKRLASSKENVQTLKKIVSKEIVAAREQIAEDKQNEENFEKKQTAARKRQKQSQKTIENMRMKQLNLEKSSQNRTRFLNKPVKRPKKVKNHRVRPSRSVKLISSMSKDGFEVHFASESGDGFETKSLAAVFDKEFLLTFTFLFLTHLGSFSCAPSASASVSISSDINFLSSESFWRDVLALGIAYGCGLQLCQTLFQMILTSQKGGNKPFKNVSKMSKSNGIKTNSLPYSRIWTAFSYLFVAFSMVNVWLQGMHQQVVLSSPGPTTSTLKPVPARGQNENNNNHNLRGSTTTRGQQQGFSSESWSDWWMSPSAVLEGARNLSYADISKKTQEQILENFDIKDYVQHLPTFEEVYQGYLEFYEAPVNFMFYKSIDAAIYGNNDAAVGSGGDQNQKMQENMHNNKNYRRNNNSQMAFRRETDAQFSSSKSRLVQLFRGFVIHPLAAYLANVSTSFQAVFGLELPSNLFLVAKHTATACVAGVVFVLCQWILLWKLF